MNDIPNLDILQELYLYFIDVLHLGQTITFFGVSILDFLVALTLMGIVIKSLLNFSHTVSSSSVSHGFRLSKRDKGSDS